MIKFLVKKFFNKLKLVSGPINLNDREGALHKIWGHVFSNHLYGDYVEFGVYKGDSIEKSIHQFNYFKKWLNSQKISKETWRQEIAIKSKLNDQVVFHGLDTFSGMPENSENNFIFRKGTFQSDFNHVSKRLKKTGQDFILYKGLFKDTSQKLNENLKNKKVVIANLDCDIYQSTKDSLDIIDEHLQMGSVLMFDDYNAFDANINKGQRKAFSEFKKHSNWIFEPFLNYMYCGKCFLIVDVKK